MVGTEKEILWMVKMQDNTIKLFCPKCFKSILLSSNFFGESIKDLDEKCSKCGFDITETVLEMVKDFNEFVNICKHLDSYVGNNYGTKLLELYLRRLVV